MGIELVYQQLKERIKPECIRLKEPMKEHTSFRIGGSADIMVLPDSARQIIDTVEICRSNSCPYYIMGNGTNLLVRDNGYRGVIIKTSANMKDCKVEGERVYGQSGILLSTLSKIIVSEGLEGFEYASGIPGTLGGAVTMNAGAYGGEIKDSIEWARVMNPDGDVMTYTKQQLELGYRTSIIQREDLIVLDCGLRFVRGDREAIQAKLDEYTRLRKAKQPLNVPSAGSTFKRPEGYYAGKLIEDAGLKGARIGDAQVSELHCGFIVNVGNATADDIIALINHVKKRVKERFNVELQPEVKVIGEP
ncbi:MAG: UDP-N-acetylmuramate dehydrogenase [Bacillota bacterium]|jgi:UDP-N-acetylmuramate dehydrogenase|nr:UDP-N-acetylmuramate dehydrogenase [Bacillota bacterium]MDD3297810.1 UDP-N-acetylmuramate dehydrogenase [Bacillota bacterium]MDD3850823.1 UDP-N-acetylmuramate dehydrogenase [Bacillota bacterium]MDD4707517.1 UDP-N-acetylmuramate dehydrogenase [Bacillota bacterium]